MLVICYEAVQNKKWPSVFNKHISGLRTVIELYHYLWDKYKLNYGITYLGFSDSSAGKESSCNAEDPNSISGSGRSAGEGISYPLQYSWASLVAQTVKNPPAMQETVFDPWDGNIPWRRERLPTPVFWPGEFHRLYSPWGCREFNTTEQLSL